jgi:hypothetical protein
MESPGERNPRERGWRARVGFVARSPLSVVLVGVGLLFVVGLGWGLPASDTWDNDGVAPRDFLVAIAETFAKGSFDVAYLHLAPVHLALLALVTLPITIAAALTSHSTSPAALIHTFIQPATMTAIAWVARSVSVFMAIGQVWALGKVGETIRGQRAGVLVATVAGVNATLVYYAHTTNLEVPYLFWASLALLQLVRAVARGEPRRLRAFAVLGALSIGTKDQAAGIFLLGAPAAIAFWWCNGAWAKRHSKEVAREAFLALGLALGIFLVTDEVVVNPAGFLARVRFLFGPASQDHAEYTRDTAGRVAVLVDLLRHFSWFFPIALAPLAIVGIVAPSRTTAEPAAQGDRRAAGLVPLFFMLSFTVTINFTTLRTEHRFILFPMEMLGIYAGLGLDAAISATAERPRRVRRWTWGAVGALLGWGLWDATAVDVVLLFDPRYEAEAWMRDHVAPGDLIETYGLNVYLPRFAADARVVRVGPEPMDRRSPLYGMGEVQDAWDKVSERQPRWIVVSDAWVWHYLSDPPSPTRGRILPRAQVEEASDRDASRYFRALLGGRLGYRMVHLSGWTSRVWPAIRIHSSTGESVWILEREVGPVSSHVRRGAQARVRRGFEVSADEPRGPIGVTPLA